MHLYPHAEVLFAGKTFFEGSGESRMSASQDKKRRSDERVLGTERRQVASQKEAKERKQSKIKWTVGTVIVVLLVVAILLGNSSLFYTARPALQVGDVKYSSAEVNYAYRTAYLSFCNQYSSILSSIGFDTRKALDEQKCTIREDFDTWDDYFKPRRPVSRSTRTISMRSMSSFPTLSSLPSSISTALSASICRRSTATV